MTTLYTAKKYAVPALEAHCVEFLKKHLRADNAFMLLTQVGVLWEDTAASRLCVGHIGTCVTTLRLEAATCPQLLVISPLLSSPLLSSPLLSSPLLSSPLLSSPLLSIPFFFPSFFFLFVVVLVLEMGSHCIALELTT
jgi:hypothetical protein